MYSVYLVLNLSVIQCLCQVLISASCLGELLSQQLIDGLQSANLTLLLSKSRKHTNRKREKIINTLKYVQ